MPFFPLLAALVLLTGCSSVISPEGLARVTPGSSLATVRQSPADHIGETLLVGGNILGLLPQEGRSYLEVYSWKLDRRGLPLSFDQAGGRFLAVTDRWFDPLAYAPGRFVTLVGTVEGSETHDLGGYDYTYPVLRISEIHRLDTPHHYDGPPRVDQVQPSLTPPWYERDNPYAPPPVSGGAPGE